MQTNLSTLVKISVLGEISNPTMPGLPASPYMVSAEGEPLLVPAFGGIVYNVGLGDRAIHVDAEQQCDIDVDAFGDEMANGAQSRLGRGHLDHQIGPVDSMPEPPRFQDRQGGYTRVIKRHERRLGDGGKTAFLELLKEGETKVQRRSAAPAPAPAPTVSKQPEASPAPETPPPAAPENPPAS